MIQAQIIIKDEHGESIRVFNDGSPYEKLKAGDIVEVEMCEHGDLKDYLVDATHWNFGHFGNTLVIHLQSVNPKPEVKMTVHLPPWSSNISHSLYLPRPLSRLSNIHTS
jgi:hypothetical protein